LFDSANVEFMLMLSKQRITMAIQSALLLKSLKHY